MTSKTIDDFEDVSSWLSVASGLAELKIEAERDEHGPSMRLDYDFKGGGGFVVARKQLSLQLPETYAFLFDIRGAAPKNKLEFKLSDASGRNVWWYHRDAFEVSADWRSTEIRSSEIEFAWGPAAGSRLAHVGAIEVAIAAGPGGKGTLSLARLRIEDRTVYAPPIVRASSELPNHEAACVLDASPSSWRSDARAPQWLQIDFQAVRELGGLVITWEDEGRARTFDVAISDDAAAWKIVHRSDAADARRTYVYMPGTATRFLRLDLRDGVSRTFGIATIAVQPFEFARSVDAFFRSIARDEPRGSYPKYLYGEQTYWSPVGLADGHTCAILNEEGMVEVDKGTFSIEPFLLADETLVTWADVAVTQRLEEDDLPVPASVWKSTKFEMSATAFAWRADGKPVLYIRYRVRNLATVGTEVVFFAALRPFQVTPPWQAFEGLGGVSRIHAIAYEAGAARVDDRRTVVSLTVPSAFGAAAFDQGSVTEHLRGGAVPPRTGVKDAFGFASGVFAYRMVIAPDDHRDVWLAVPFGTVAASTRDGDHRLGNEDDGARALEACRAFWRGKVRALDVRVPLAGRAHVDTLRTATAHILVHRDGPALHPGPRRYTRAWIRDGAIMAAALLRMGCAEEAKAFTRWYAGYQAPDGNVPCAVDEKGADWLVEHDSHGELIFAVAECHRFTRDAVFLAELWPAVMKAVGYIERLRASRLGAQFDTGEKRARRGLLPESASHEGYLAHPVHAYWDDFWALRGLHDAVYLAEQVGDEAVAPRIAEIAAALQASLYASIDRTIAERKVDYVPGSVEWADFDPTATSNAISLLDEGRNLPHGPLERTFDEYMAGFRRRRANEIDWANYSPYEVRIAAALIRLGRRGDANQLLDFLLGDRRPLAWNQWPEIAWRDPTSPGHLGDVPHSWIGAEYVLAFCSMLAFEEVGERTLVLAAGVPAAWLDDPRGIEVRGMLTYYGTLGYTLRRENDATRVRLELSRGAEMETPRIVIAPPLPRPLVQVEVNGRPVATYTASRCVVTETHCDVVLRC